MASAASGGLANILSSFTTLSKGLVGILTAGFLVQLAVPVSKQYLGLVAGKTLPFVWNILTSGLLEDRMTSLVVDCLAVLVLTRVVEPAYGQREFLRFLGASLAGAGAATFAVVIVVYYASVLAGARSGDENIGGELLYTPICGFHGGVAALLVALKQVAPDSEVTVAGTLRFRAKHLAAVYVLGVCAYAFALGDVARLVPFTVFGAYAGWAYLRFVQQRPEGGARGDQSEEFRFASFFPGRVQPTVDRVAQRVSRVTKLGAAAGGGGGFEGGAAAASAGGGGLLLRSAAAAAPEGGDAARRRERGARALEERLSLKAAAAATAGGAAEPAVAAPAAAAEGGSGDDVEAQQEA